MQTVRDWKSVSFSSAYMCACFVFATHLSNRLKFIRLKFITVVCQVWLLQICFLVPEPEQHRLELKYDGEMFHPRANICIHIYVFLDLL